MRLQDRGVVVTGGASGIGHSICTQVVREGGLAIVADSKMPLTPLLLSSARHRSVPFRSMSHPSRALRMLSTKSGRIDVLVNSAGLRPTCHFSTPRPSCFRRPSTSICLALSYAGSKQLDR